MRRKRGRFVFLISISLAIMAYSMFTGGAEAISEKQNVGVMISDYWWGRNWEPPLSDYLKDTFEFSIISAIPDDLDQYDILMIVGYECMTQEESQKLRDYVVNGGKLLVSFEGGLGECGDRRLGDIEEFVISFNDIFSHYFRISSDQSSFITDYDYIEIIDANGTKRGFKRDICWGKAAFLRNEISDKTAHSYDSAFAYLSTNGDGPTFMAPKIIRVLTVLGISDYDPWYHFESKKAAAVAHEGYDFTMRVSTFTEADLHEVDLAYIAYTRTMDKSQGDALYNFVKNGGKALIKRETGHGTKGVTCDDYPCFNEVFSKFGVTGDELFKARKKEINVGSGKAIFVGGFYDDNVENFVTNIHALIRPSYETLECPEPPPETVAPVKTTPAPIETEPPIEAEYLIRSAECSTCPVIDGVLTSSEWDGSETQEFTLLSKDKSESYQVTLRAMNDAVNMYFAVTVSDDDYNRFDSFYIRLKDPDSGFLDFLYVQAEGFSYDGFYKDPMITRDKTDNGTDDINASVKFSENEAVNYVFEFSRTLDSSDDAHDISLSAGDYVELQANYGDSDKGRYRGQAWPPNEYAVLVLAKATSSGSWPPVTKPPETPEPQKPKITFVFVPVNWKSSMSDFDRKVDERIDFFLDATPLSECNEKVKVIKSHENCEIIPTSTIAELWQVKRCGKRVSNYYDRIIGLTDDDSMYGETAGFTTINDNVVIATTKRVLNVGHELGHTFGLKDEYCDFKSKLYGVMCGFEAQPNPLMPELGCYNENDPEGRPPCCDECKGRLFGLLPGESCCEGNIGRSEKYLPHTIYTDEKGNPFIPKDVMRNIMSGAGEPTEFSKVAYDHLTGIDQLGCE